MKKKFDHKIRGYTTKDTGGTTMTASVKVLQSNEKMMRDVVAYIMTLKWQEYRAMSDQNQDPSPDEVYNKKVFVITSICVVLYVGAVISFVLWGCSMINFFDIGTYVEAASSYAADIDSVILLIAALVGGPFIIAEALLIGFVLKFRKKEGVKAKYITGETKKEKR